jgi:pyrimidine-nucleoside phosphorylase
MPSAYDIIITKREGKILSREEIAFMVDGFLCQKVSEAQMAAFLMAVLWRGMNAEETWFLTKAMAESGDVVDLSPIPGVKVDKHSTGGVGDKTTLIVAPLVAAAGVPVAKFTGRALGHTGGTVDKLESIPGFSTRLTREQFLQQVRSIGIALAGATENLAPADKRIYALRDETATVESIPLIVGSILSKKIAGGAEAFVFDVKAGNGAFMPTVESATELADALVATSHRAGKRAVAVISDMNQPLGCAIGNALEVAEAIEVLQGGGPSDVRELALRLAEHMLILSRNDFSRSPSQATEVATTPPRSNDFSRSQATEVATTLLDSGAALQKFRELVAAQGGDVSVVDNPQKLPQSTHRINVTANASGIVTAIDALALGRLAGRLGAGRMSKDAAIDPAGGFVLHRKLGDPVQQGETLITVHANQTPSDDFLTEVRRTFTVGDQPTTPPPLLHAVRES